MKTSRNATRRGLAARALALTALLCPLAAAQRAEAHVVPPERLHPVVVSYQNASVQTLSHLTAIALAERAQPAAIKEKVST